MGLVIALTTFVLLLAAFGSVVLPVKAVAMNVLSLSAMYRQSCGSSRTGTCPVCFAELVSHSKA